MADQHKDGAASSFFASQMEELRRIRAEAYVQDLRDRSRAACDRRVRERWPWRLPSVGCSGKEPETEEKEEREERERERESRRRAFLQKISAANTIQRFARRFLPLPEHTGALAYLDADWRLRDVTVAGWSPGDGHPPFPAPPMFPLGTHARFWTRWLNVARSDDHHVRHTTMLHHGKSLCADNGPGEEALEHVADQSRLSASEARERRSKPLRWRLVRALGGFPFDAFAGSEEQHGQLGAADTASAPAAQEQRRPLLGNNEATSGALTAGVGDDHAVVDPLSPEHPLWRPLASIPSFSSPFPASGSIASPPAAEQGRAAAHANAEEHEHTMRVWFEGVRLRAARAITSQGLATDRDPQSLDAELQGLVPDVATFWSLAHGAEDAAASELVGNWFETTMGMDEEWE